MWLKQREDKHIGRRRMRVHQGHYNVRLLIQTILQIANSNKDNPCNQTVNDGLAVRARETYYSVKHQMLMDVRDETVETNPPR
ncbi:hypothetical protein Mapa_007267 [Marchantia paleacea]|nr:hypothetical protein Mapa_007267 [Marchantia paleacea]